MFLFYFFYIKTSSHRIWNAPHFLAKADANWRRATGKFNNQTKYAGKGAI